MNIIKAFLLIVINKDIVNIVNIIAIIIILTYLHF